MNKVMTYEEISSAKYIDSRNDEIRKNFEEKYSSLRQTWRDVSFMAIYNDLAMTYNLSVPQVRRIIRGHK